MIEEHIVKLRQIKVLAQQGVGVLVRKKIVPPPDNTALNQFSKIF